MSGNMHKTKGMKPTEETALGMKKLIERIGMVRLEKGGEVRNRINELKSNKNWFSELCFCILTANYTAEGGIRIQNAVNDFSGYTEAEIEAILRRLGYRFPRKRAEYLHLAKAHKEKLHMLREIKDSCERREWLVKNVKGIGYKEASHFLRNIGYLDVAIIDRHILNVLFEYGIIGLPKTITRKKYLEIEQKLIEIAKKTEVPPGELDFYLWYMKTGKILK